MNSIRDVVRIELPASSRDAGSSIRSRVADSVDSSLRDEGFGGVVAGRGLTVPVALSWSREVDMVAVVMVCGVSRKIVDGLGCYHGQN